MLRDTLRRNKGITLIALVVTIIVLLILAGISIAMLTGQNGILNRAAEAKEKTRAAQEDENEKLQGYEKIINQYAENLPIGEETTPYLPNSTFSKKEGDLATGLVIQDANQNEYVWVEVPTTIYNNTTYNNNGANKPQNADEWKKIRDCLKAYTSDYSNSDYKDTNTDGTTYSDDYKNMLKSVYTNGGFWLGRYEAGLEGDTPRISSTAISASDKAVVKQNKIPYNFVTRDEAQELATRMNYNGCTSSLIFGIQWDLTLKYIEEKTVELAEEANKDTVRADIKSKLTSNSTTIGNYYNSEFTLNRGKFATYNDLSDWKSYNSEEKQTLVTGSQKQAQSSNSNAILLTTGATDATNLQNIYDIAGNVWEWTREIYATSNPCVVRGGCYYYDGSNNPAKDRSNDSTSSSNSVVGFRLGLWK
ncbi:MAG: SUMF1/EgtB/PvdO family nonheme iron enzyme [Clostridia bacterium]